METHCSTFVIITNNSQNFLRLYLYTEMPVISNINEGDSNARDGGKQTNQENKGSELHETMNHDTAVNGTQSKQEVAGVTDNMEIKEERGSLVGLEKQLL